jgi:hypothetical protein
MRRPEERSFLAALRRDFIFFLDKKSKQKNQPLSIKGGSKTSIVAFF